MDGSAHQRYRSRLAVLAAGGHLSAVTEAAVQLGAAVTERPRVLRAGLSADPDLLATLVIAVGPRPRDAVHVSLWPARPSTEAPYLVQLPDLGWLGAWPVTADPVVATADRLDGGGPVALVRYHPNKRATVRIGPRPGCAEESVRYAKVFSDDRGRARHRLAEQLYAAAEDGRLHFRVPRPAHYDGERFAMWQHALPGEPGNALLSGSSGPELARRLGAALGSLPHSGLCPPRRLTEADLFTRVQRGAADLSLLVPALVQRVDQLLDRLRAERSSPDPAPTTVVHGSPDPSQWLVVEPEGDLPPGLLDFDRCALGDPEHDVACFLAHVEAINHPGLDAAGVESAFATGYQDAYGPLDADRLARYRTLRRLGRVVRYARSLRLDGADRAARALAAAERGAG